jgi:hypothetical protein
MKDNPERFGDSELDQLLARGHLSGGQYDAIETRVLEGVRPERRKRWWFVLAPVTAAVSLTGVWLLVRPAATPGEFTAKGGTEVRAAIDMGCEGANPHVCRLGQTLMFSVGANTERGYLAAYAERAGAPASERIWYFPARDGAGPHVEPATETRVLGEGVRLGAPHAPGRYKVRVWLSETPVDRSDEGAVRRARAGEIALEIVE